MIYIVSESFDISTNKVLEWIHFFKKDFRRINTDTNHLDVSINIDENNSFLENTFWIRRGYFPFVSNELKGSIYQKHLKSEYFKIHYFLEKFGKKVIGSYGKEANNNKLINFIEAKKVGLLTPHSILTNSKKELLNFTKPNKRYIVKPIESNFTYSNEEFYINGHEISILDLEIVPENFGLTYFQEYIEKQFEIRVFFIEDEYFPMAIFSQNDEKTKIDFRNYNTEKPNRCVPFILPSNILEKLKHFTRNNNYSTGSFDLIYSTDHEYVFLEINPMGQFDWLSVHCNYNIEKRIAEILIKKDG